MTYTEQEKQYIAAFEQAHDDFNAGRKDKWPEPINKTGDLYFLIENTQGVKFLHVWTEEPFTTKKRANIIGKVILKAFAVYEPEEKLTITSFNQYQFGIACGSDGKYGYNACYCNTMVPQGKWNEKAGLELFE